MVTYTHEEFMEAKGRKLLEEKGYTVKDNLIVYPEKEEKKEISSEKKKEEITDAAAEEKKEETLKEKLQKQIDKLMAQLKKL